MALEGDEVTSDWDGVRWMRACVLPGCEGEECRADREECDGCAKAKEVREMYEYVRALEDDGPMMLYEATLLPDGSVKWADKGRFCD